MSNPTTVIEDYSESIPQDRTIADQQQDLQDAQQIVQGNVPEVVEPLDNVVNLPRGVRSNGTWHTECEVRELTGSDEEVIARQKQQSAIFNVVTALGVVRIGKLQLTEMPLSERQGILSTLLVGELEQVFLRLSIATYGADRTIAYVCPSCQEKGSVDINLLKDIPVPAMVDPYRKYEHTTTKGVKLEFRLVTGSDMEEASLRPTSAEQNTVMLSECILLANGDPLVDPLGFARGLSLRDRKAILEIMSTEQPNPDMQFNLDCPKCSFNMLLEVAWGDIFLY